MIRAYGEDNVHIQGDLATVLSEVKSIVRKASELAAEQFEMEETKNPLIDRIAQYAKLDEDGLMKEYERLREKFGGDSA